MKTPKLLCTIAAIALAQGSLFAVNTDPVGFVSVTVPANSDAILAVPLNRTSEFKGLTSALSGTSGSVTITVAGTPNWTAGQFAPLATANKTYALQLASGAKEGLVLPITNNGTNTVTVTVSASDDLTGVLANGEQIDVIPYWTPGTFISAVPNGSEMYSYINPNTGNSPSGINLTPALLMVFDSGSGEWLNQNDESSLQNLALPFGSAFTFRNKSGSSVTISIVGSVPMTAHRSILRTQLSGAAQDVRIGYSSPVQELLSNVGFPAALGDQIFVYDNSSSGINKSPASILIYDGAQWLDGNDESPVPTFALQPGWGYVFRLAARPSATTLVWKDLQSYLN
jgi:uncharacterized protein (TIGR02597 family)